MNVITGQRIIFGRKFSWKELTIAARHHNEDKYFMNSNSNFGDSSTINSFMRLEPPKYLTVLSLTKFLFWFFSETHLFF